SPSLKTAVLKRYQEREAFLIVLSSMMLFLVIYCTVQYDHSLCKMFAFIYDLRFNFYFVLLCISFMSYVLCNVVACLAFMFTHWNHNTGVSFAHRHALSDFQQQLCSSSFHALAQSTQRN